MIPQARAATTYGSPTSEDIPAVRGVEDVSAAAISALHPSATGSLMIVSLDIFHTSIPAMSSMAFHNMSSP